MTMTIDPVAAAAERLRQAYAGAPVASLRDLLDPLDIEGAYAVQAHNTQAWKAGGRRIVGRKIGLTAKAVQQQFGVDQPDFGVLFEDMRVADGGWLGPGLLQPKVEAEVALVLGRDVADAEPGVDEIAEATDFVVPAIEVVDSRIADWKISFADTVADNGSSARFVLGGEPRPLAGLDLYSCGMVLEIDGQVASVGAGAACLGHPLKAAAWLARTLAERGERLCAGDVVLTGSLGPIAALAPGQHIRAIIGGLGTVSFNYEGAR
ncbi:MAG TPA: fumarylacetoacetate hydrolase family protein [Phenylobacterium sp.]|uniref:2-keto-4-pentenoate hydratase n=1 Tax=Phenylobacterium sp. TaxID=1871053 RepID=UPI002B49BD6E|nr:fumarylacetoacetate hydrolase family protein [Phenylobacterium sp.]HKR87264.1 fumarylacetoacetate hydrolase family protein [Phenylobacterium sp.]